jgi:hydroxyacylglutathione hydrolase
MMRKIHRILLMSSLIVTLLPAPPSWCELAPGSMDVHWDEGAEKCPAKSQALVQVHAYNQNTYILRQNLCATFEAPFMYLLVGSRKALLIDTGDVADAKQMPLADTVMHLLPGEGTSRLPLLVVHTHRHLDHRAGDEQFAHLPNTEVVGYDLDSVRRFYHFTDWPNGVAQIDLGVRTVDVLPTPGHNETEVSFYDRNTGLFFSGDFFLPARLLVDDISAYRASAQRAVDFVRDRPLSFILGGHIEMNDRGELFPWQSQYHPHEHVLQMSKDDLLALPAALRAFNGFYTTRGTIVMMNSIHILIALSMLAFGLLIAITWALVRSLKRILRKRRQPAPAL